jgi:hypothetical protein
MTVLVGQPLRCNQQSALSRRGPSRVQCAALPQQQRLWERSGVKQLAVGLAAAIMIQGSPASAGVVFEERTLKKVFQSEPVEAIKQQAAKLEPNGPVSISAPSLPSLPSFSLPNASGNVALLTLPLAIGGLFVGALAWRTIDPGFSKFFDDTLCKNSNTDGAGYEFGMKTGVPFVQKKGKRPTGTKKIAKKAASKGESAKKKGLFSF